MTTKTEHMATEGHQTVPYGMLRIALVAMSVAFSFSTNADSDNEWPPEVGHAEVQVGGVHRDSPTLAMTFDGLLLAEADNQEGSVYAACWGLFHYPKTSERLSSSYRGVSSRVVSIHHDDLEDLKDIWAQYLAQKYERGNRDGYPVRLRRWNCVIANSKLRAKAAAARQLAEHPTSSSWQDDTEFL